jgi:hypothetical protein
VELGWEVGVKLQSKLTPKQLACLSHGTVCGAINPWDFGSTTIAVLKARAFIAKCVGFGYVVTDAGRNELARIGRFA